MTQRVFAGQEAQDVLTGLRALTRLGCHGANGGRCRCGDVQQMTRGKLRAFLCQACLGTVQLGLLGLALQAFGGDVGFYATHVAAQAFEVAGGVALSHLEVEQVFLLGLKLRRGEEALRRQALVALQALLSQRASALCGVKFALRMSKVGLQALEAIAQGLFALERPGLQAACFLFERSSAGLKALAEKIRGVAMITADTHIQNGQNLIRPHLFAF